MALWLGIILTGVVVLWLLRRLLIAPHGRLGIPSNVLFPFNEVYYLPSTSPPRLSGYPLAIFTFILEEPLLGWLVQNLLFANVGLISFRSIIPSLSDVNPTFQPLITPPRLLNDNPNSENVNTFLCEVPLEVESGLGEKSSFRYKTVYDYACGYRKGHFSPETVARSIIRSLPAINKDLNAFITWDEQDILKQAKASSFRFQKGEPLSVLDGVPIAVKDEIDQLPYSTTVGTNFLGKRRLVTEDATVISRLRALGAVLLGKTNMHEIGIGTTGFNKHFGTPRNPHNTQHYTGGSSSGSACVVASGICPVAIGADGGGSVRIPAALCGVYGLKPTYGRISEHGAAPLCWTVAHIGPIACSSTDSALLYYAIAGKDPKCAETLLQPNLSITLQNSGWASLSLKGLKIGVFKPYFEDCESIVAEKCNACLAYFESLGACITDIQIPDLFLLRAAHGITIISEMATSMNAYPTFAGHHDCAVRSTLALARKIAATDYVSAQKLRTKGIDAMKNIFQQVDVIVTPGVSCAAPKIAPDVLPYGESDIDTVTKLMKFSFLANFTGVPAIVFPVGYDKGNLPISMQCMASWWQEELLLSLAKCSEDFIALRRPQYFVSFS